MKYLFIYILIFILDLNFLNLRSVELMNSFEKKIDNSIHVLDDKVILHTSPHPDDVTLGYLPYVNWLLNNFKNEHYFLTMTSGSNAVRNSDLIEILQKIEQNILENKENTKLQDNILKNLLNLNPNLNKSLSILNKIKYLRKDLDKNIDNHEIQILKGSIREFEEELVWSSFNIPKDNIIHFRAKFYFKKNNDYSDDINNFYNLLLKINPDIITLALDPKDKAPKTHYKTFLVVKEAIKKFHNFTKKNIRIIGYRNVWSQFLPGEADIFFPVNENDFKLLNKIFINSYKTQINAMFPNSNYKGNFAQVAIEMMKESFKKIKNYFKNEELKNIKGFCFLKEFGVDKFLNYKL
ncbi:hypothetical protein GF385_03370 [Candidatus Dependentiae bacterium]|nr:hypothetical protein [Candidatus Dependentiae bacterium]